MKSLLTFLFKFFMLLLKAIMGLIAVVIVLMFFEFVGIGVQPLLALLFGWLVFPFRTLPKMTFEPTAFVVGAAALVLLVVVTHGLCRWLYGHLQAASATPRPWRLRWTASIVAILVFLFASGIGMIVVIHETGWIVRAKEPIMTYSGIAARRMTSTNQLKQIGLSLHNYAQSRQEFPPGGTSDPKGDLQHSWETLILPFMEGDQPKPNMSLPWNHPDNAECFRTERREFLNPGVSGEHRVDANGYGLSHYSVNSHVMGLNRGIRFAEVTDGLSNTVFGGEINDHFPAWGYPINWRDPAEGINKSPGGFGAPWPGGANFMFMDGSVKFLSNNVDPKVLRAISTPAGGEKVDPLD